MKFKNNVSDELYTKCGVRQGTVLRPYIFAMYINGIVNHLNHCIIKMSTHDTTLYITGSNIEDMFQKIYSDSCNIFKWICVYSLCLNINKSSTFS